MNKLSLLILLFFLSFSTIITAFDGTLMSLQSPSTLDKGMMVFGVQHRFYGPINDSENSSFLGLDSGANTHMMLRYVLHPRLDTWVQRIRRNKELGLGLRYTQPFWRTEGLFLSSEYVTFEVDATTSNSSVISNLGTQIYLGRRVLSTVNVVYDYYYDILGTGVGLEWIVDSSIHLTGEFYPSHQKSGDKSVILLGLKCKTFGHRFFIGISNSTQIGLRAHPLGTSSDDWYLGFNMLRVFDTQDLLKQRISTW